MFNWWKERNRPEEVERERLLSWDAYLNDPKGYWGIATLTNREKHWLQDFVQDNCPKNYVPKNWPPPGPAIT